MDFKKLVSIHIILIERKLPTFAQIASTYQPDKNSGITLSGLHMLKIIFRVVKKNFTNMLHNILEPG